MPGKILITPMGSSLNAYREKKTLLPGTFGKTPVARFFCWCGRQSLFIYLLHQPIVYGLLELVLALQK